MDYDDVMFIQIQWFMVTWCLIETRQTWFRGGLRHPETGLTFWARSWFGFCVGHTSDARGGAGHGEWTGYGQLAKGWLCMAQVPAYGNIEKPRKTRDVWGMKHKKAKCSKTWKPWSHMKIKVQWTMTIENTWRSTWKLKFKIKWTIQTKNEN